MMRRWTAYALMAIGFVWIAGVCLDLFGAQHHVLWIWYSQNLTAGEMIQRADAIGQMRKLELAIQDVYQPLVVPALLIVIGGILNGIGKRKGTQQSAASLPRAPSGHSEGAH